MANLILTTFDRVPELPRGCVRDIQVRWALEEAGLSHRVESTPLRARTAEHFGHQPFGQVPWLFATLNSLELASLPWCLAAFSAEPKDTPGWMRLDGFLRARLAHLEPLLAAREWLAGPFSVAEIAMADALRLVDRFDGLADHPACRGYLARATGRPSFAKAHADQMAHFAAAD